MVPVLRRLHEIARVPLIAKPNAGFPELTERGAVYNCPPAAFAGCMDALAEAGVMIFGGCCGTDETHVRAIAEKSASLTLHRPEPQQAGLLPCATEKELFFLDPAVSGGTVLPCNAALEERLEEAMEDDAALVTVELTSAEELDSFADAQYLITKPLSLRCADAGLLEQALRLYQGRALYEGPLSDEALRPLAAKYGLIT